MLGMTGLKRQPTVDALPIFRPQTRPGTGRPATDTVLFAGKKTKPAIEGMEPAERIEVEKFATQYKKFLEKASCSPWAARIILKEAQAHGFQPLPPVGTMLQKGGRYYVNNNYESVALIILGERDPVVSGFNMVGAHMDSPQLMLKPNTVTDSPEKTHGVVKFKTQPHGGGTWMTWFNRRLGIAGRIFKQLLGPDGKPERSSKTLLPDPSGKFVRISDMALTIPVEPIHFRREMNKEGRPVSSEKDMNPWAAFTKGDSGNPDEAISAHVNRVLKEKHDIDLSQEGSRAELYLYSLDKPSDVGVDKSMILGQGHDDRSMCYAAMQALFEASTAQPHPEKTSIAFFFNDEEVGSQNVGGAKSRWVETLVGRLVDGHPASSVGDTVLARETALGNSLIFSADVAHGFEPSQDKYHDPDNRIDMGHGPVIKDDTQGHYATTRQGVALAKDLADRAGVQVQVLSTNQDVSCGTTIGPGMAANTNALTVDIGAPVLSMHSIQEVIAKVDLYLTKKLFASFFKND